MARQRFAQATDSRRPMAPSPLLMRIAPAPDTARFRLVVRTATHSRNLSQIEPCSKTPRLPAGGAAPSGFRRA
ncbi:hypothetical protein STVA_37070 [Allostella vacuolata]|nr:hypothetical protein STVA_37070 [Stella vacuolata]